MATKKLAEDIPTITDEDVANAAVTEGPSHLNEQYVVTTVNREFTGSIMGIQITNGRGLLNSQSIDPRLHRSFERVVAEMKVMPGYTLTRV